MASSNVQSRRSPRPGSSTRNQRASSSAKRRRPGLGGTEAKAGDAPNKPDLEALRRSRLAYYTLPPAERRRVDASSPSQNASSQRRAPSERSRQKSASATVKSHGRPRRNMTPGERRTADYVYGRENTPFANPGPQGAIPNSERPSSSRSDASQLRKLPSVGECDIGPDDSVSVVASRRRRKSSMTERQSLRRSNTVSTKLAPVAEAEGNVEHTPTQTPTKSGNRVSSFLGSLMRRNTTSAVPTSPRLVDCLTCGSDDVPATKTAKLSCGHRMCHDCLKRIFEMSVKDPAHMPPKCCTDEHIPLKHVDKLLDTKFKIRWNRRYQEYNTKNRIYCPAPKCGTWIRPNQIHTVQGRKFAKCPRCETKVCTLCHTKMHRSSECPKDPEILKLVEEGKKSGWQSCYNCRAMIELKEGCNHMTCRCTAQFCMLCGQKWKTCDCPWFNYNRTSDEDRLTEMRVPQGLDYVVRRLGIQHLFPDPAVPAATDLPPHEPTRRIPRTFNDEIGQRRQQERDDENLARRLQHELVLTQNEPEVETRPEALRTWGVGNADEHHLNDNFLRNRTNTGLDVPDDTAFGRRGTRESARRRRSRQAAQAPHDSGLVMNFLGDESVLGPR